VTPGEEEPTASVEPGSTPGVAAGPVLLTVEALGRMLGIGPRGARKKLERGELPGFRLGRRWYVRPADLDARIGELLKQEKAKRSPDAARILRGLPSHGTCD
jgi:hypothetical protein